ncbi:hypothetical protein MHBO_001181 [Bonamia ostreae]|uniref:Uncharacterized protein n=1 Tax=Bonamia ostreae TaxID=126728 RepID=A0ABV2AI23_9EUKA
MIIFKMMKYFLCFANMSILAIAHKNTCELPEKTGLLIHNVTDVSDKYLTFEISCKSLLKLYFKNKKQPLKVKVKFFCDRVYKKVDDLNSIDFYVCKLNYFAIFISFFMIVVVIIIIIGALDKCSCSKCFQRRKNIIEPQNIHRRLSTISEESGQIENETRVLLN